MPMSFPQIVMDLDGRTGSRVVVEISHDSAARLTINDCGRYLKALSSVIDGQARMVIKMDDSHVIEFGREANKIVISIIGQGSRCVLSVVAAKRHADEIRDAEREALTASRRN